MDNKIFDPAFNDLLATKLLFMSPGWLKYENHVKQLIVSEQGSLDRMLDGNKPLQEKDIHLLNLHATVIRCYKSLLQIKEEMLDEVDPERELKMEKTGFETPEPQDAPAITEHKDETKKGQYVEHKSILENEKSPTDSEQNKSENK